ncbi:Alpha/beta hydrolase fold-1 [Aspergillus alliaceus]|uniref:Alpha/beta hydrolase fold-1 n=1 Tax=Petromyces alliaceus TaxID=209559 RepID=A0A5N7CMF0_PETAA|nr:Alpha/beta hydrolase fold-1 [Aspergillus alliaceus]
MISSKPTLLISGAWHRPESYSTFTKALKSNSYEVHVPHLPSINRAKPPSANLTTDTDLIRTYVESLADASRTVVVIMNSYGGQVGTNALTGLLGGVAQFVYICGSLFTEGACIVDIAKEFGSADRLANASDIVNILSKEELKALMGGPGIDDADADALISTLTRWNGDAMFQPLERCAWKEIPVTYIQMTKDMAMPLMFQKPMVEKLNSAHSVRLSMTEEVVRIVGRIVGKNV